MGIRFQRSIRIGKGLRLNLSKSGLGFSAGPRGAGVSVGPRGVYGHAGIPGTGLYARQKLGGNTPSSSPRTASSPSSPGEGRSIEVGIEIDENSGRETVSLREGGREIHDESVLRKVKQDPAFKVKLEKARKRVFDEITERSRALIDIHKHTLDLPDWEHARQELANAKPQLYTRVQFPEPAPEPDSIRADLVAEANRTVRTLFGRKRKREAYVEQRLDATYEQELHRWNDALESHEREQDKTEQEKNEALVRSHEKWKEGMRAVLEATPDGVADMLQDSFSEIQLPVEFSVNFDVREKGHVIFLDVDLPEIEDYPTKKAQLLKSGKVSVKDKTQKEIKLDYLNSVAGISFYFASVAFACAPSVATAIVSGYTQRVNPATGNQEDTYVYSVKYPKAAFYELNFQRIEPHVALQEFEHKMLTTKTYELKAIDPLYRSRRSQRCRRPNVETT